VGALSLLRDKLEDTFLVVNGDILTDLNLNTFITHHKQNNVLLTIATTERVRKMDYGVVEETQGVLMGFKEKPTLVSSVSMGVYCMEPDILEFIPCGTPYGFDDLVLHMLELGIPVRAFRHSGEWLDLGRAEDFIKAQEIDWDEQALPLTTRAA